MGLETMMLGSFVMTKFPLIAFQDYGKDPEEMEKDGSCPGTGIQGKNQKKGRNTINFGITTSN